MSSVRQSNENYLLFKITNRPTKLLQTLFNLTKIPVRDKKGLNYYFLYSTSQIIHKILMDTSALVCYSTYKSSEVQKGICSGFSSEKETWSIEFMIVAVFYVSPKATSPEALTLFASFHRLCVFEKLKTLKNINPRASSFHPVELRKQLCLVGAGDGSSISGGGCPGVFAMSRSLPTLQPVDVYGCTRGLC